ncbi:MAG: ATP-binding protein [Gemmatimonadaceae bacterium]
MTRAFTSALTRRMAVPVLLTFLALALLTTFMLVFRDRLDKAHVALLYLLVVLGGSAAGRVAGLTVGVVAFVLFNFFFLPPFNTLVVTDPLDWLVLAAFLITSVVAAELLNRQRMQATLAERRRVELDQMSTLGAETLNAARAEHALSAIARVIKSSVDVARCELFARDAAVGVRLIADTGGDSAASAGLLTYVLESGRTAVALSDGTVHVVSGGERLAGVVDEGSSAYAMPLSVRGTIVGVLRVSAEAGLQLTVEKLHVLNALAYYAALAIDRQRMENSEEAAEELRRVDRLKDALLAAVSHDLRTPLTTIKGLAHEISLEGSERARVIEHEAEQLSSMVEGLLELSQLNAHAMPLRIEINTLDELVGAALQRAAKVLENRSVPVVAENNDLLVGRFDLAQSVRILVNLFENAAKYSPATASIDVHLQRDGKELEITVSDRGAGIQPGDEDRIFEPFFRSRTETADVRGAGLGLSIAKRLAEAQQGSLRVSAREGGGSSFALRLPAENVPTS